MNFFKKLFWQFWGKVEIITEVCDKFQKSEILRVCFITKWTIYHISYCAILKEKKKQNAEDHISFLSLGTEGKPTVYCVLTSKIVIKLVLSLGSKHFWNSLSAVLNALVMNPHF